MGNCDLGGLYARIDLSRRIFARFAELRFSDLYTTSIAFTLIFAQNCDRIALIHIDKSLRRRLFCTIEFFI